MKKFLLIFLLIVLVVGGVFFYVRYYVPYSSSSVRAGELNYVMYKGVVFKTWEGKLIQSGFRSKTAGAVQSNEFEFSIENEELAQKLMNLTGSNVKLHYKEYYGVLPWRGYTKYIVDSIVAVDKTPTATKYKYQESIHPLNLFYHDKISYNHCFIDCFNKWLFS